MYSTLLTVAMITWLGDAQVTSNFEVTNNAWSTCTTYDGKAKCWGDNRYGNLGTGNKEDLNSPPSRPVDLGSDFEARKTSCGSYHVCALSTGHSVKCWGRWQGTGYDTDNDIDSAEEMGNHLPALSGPWKGGVQQSGVQDIKAVTDVTCVLDDIGDVYCFGEDRPQILGIWNGYKTATEAVKLPVDFTVDSLGGGYHTLCVASAEGVVTCWSPDDYDLAVTERDVGSAVESVQCGYRHCCAVTTSHTLDCWGVDEDGAIPYDVGMNDDIRAVSVGYRSTCVITSTLMLPTIWVRCFGWPSYSQLGDASATSPNTFALSSAFTVSNVGISIGTQSSHYCVFDRLNPSSSGMQCWGWNAHGQLGYGDDIPYHSYDPNMPTVAVVGLTWLGWSPPTSGSLEACQGDCDRDSDCQSGLICVMDAVPEGCSGAMHYSNADYCGVPIIADLEWLGWSPWASGSLRRCQGDCDRDSHCQDGLVCVMDAVPVGCSGEMESAFADYCGDATTNAAANGVVDHDPVDAAGSDGAASFDDFIPMVFGAAAAVVVIAGIVAVVVATRKRKTAATESVIEMKAVHVPDESVTTRTTTEMEVVTEPEPNTGTVAIE